MDRFALESHERAVRAIDEGRFENEIVSLATRRLDENGAVGDHATLVLEKSKLSLDDIDLIEINEAFASVILAWLGPLK